MTRPDLTRQLGYCDQAAGQIRRCHGFVVQRGHQRGKRGCSRAIESFYNARNNIAVNHLFPDGVHFSHRIECQQHHGQRSRFAGRPLSFCLKRPRDSEDMRGEITHHHTNSPYHGPPPGAQEGELMTGCLFRR